MKQNEIINKVFFCDLDGTLLSYQNEKYYILEENIKHVRIFEENNHFIITTGRHGDDVMDIIKANDLKTKFFIVSNGGAIFYNSQKIKTWEINKSIACRIATELEQITNYITITDGKSLYVKNKNLAKEWRKNENHVKEHPFKSNIDLIKELNEIIGFGIVCPLSKDNNETITLIKNIEQKYNNYIEVYYSKAGEYSFIDINSKGVNKATAVKWILNLNRYNHTYAAGDALNDYEMLSVVDVGYKMVPGEKTLLKVASKEIKAVHEALKEINQSKSDKLL